MYCVIKLPIQEARIDRAIIAHRASMKGAANNESTKRREACYDKGYGMRELHKIAISGSALEFSRYISIRWSMILTTSYSIINNAEMARILILSTTFNSHKE